MRAGALQKLQAQMYSFMQDNADEMALVGKKLAKIGTRRGLLLKLFFADEDMKEESAPSTEKKKVVGEPVTFGPDYWSAVEESRRYDFKKKVQL
jgi:hypothetical protein